MSAAPVTARSAPPPIVDTRRLKWMAAALAVVVVGVVVWLLVRAAGEEASAEKWDLLTKLRYEYEPKEEPFHPDPAGLVRAQSESYLQKLEQFLESHAKGSGDALEPQVRWLIAKTARDNLLAMRDVTDFEKRKPLYDKAIAQLTYVRDHFPEYPPNWSNLAPPERGSTVRMLLEETQQARDYEEENLPRERMPKDDVVVLVRTDLGDVRLGLYADDAPEAVASFLQKAREGRYDGTAFYEKIESGDDASGRRALRGGDPATRGAKPYDEKAPEAFGKLGPDEQLLPGDSRNRIPHTRGILSAWHGSSSEYDETAELLLVAKRSPDLDYEYTPIGRALDEASLATVDRIWARRTWGDEKPTSARPEDRFADRKSIQDYLQVPVTIVKVLVYEKGALLEGGVTPVPQKQIVEDSEKSLSTVKPDAYRAEPPPKPEPPKPPADDRKPANEKPAGDQPEDKPADDKPADDKPAEPKPADEKPAETPEEKPADR